MSVDPLYCPHKIPVKLFVGQIPKTWDEKDLSKFFENFGAVCNAQIIRKDEGTHRGCAFVTFNSMTEADIAIEALNENFYLPGSATKFQLKWAEGEKRRLDIPVDLHHATKLVVYHFPPSLTDEHLRVICGEYGTLRVFKVVRDPERPRLYLKYTTKEQALTAFKYLRQAMALVAPEARPPEVFFAEFKHRAGPAQSFEKQPRAEKVLFFEFFDDTGRPYYFNSLTQEVQWTRPTGFQVEIKSQADYYEMQKASGTTGTQFRVKVFGLPEGFSNEEMEGLFEPYETQEQFITQEDGKLVLMAGFEEEAKARECLEGLNGVEFGAGIVLTAQLVTL